MKTALILSLFLPVFAFAKPLFIGDSLTHTLATSAMKHIPVDGLYKESTGLTDRSSVKWNNYVQTMSFHDYETVVISLGANDGIGASQVTNYQDKATQFIRQIQQDNPSASIIWILPPVMKNPATEAALVNTRKAIRQAVDETQVASFDPEVVIGREFALIVNNVQVRTSDGIHYTSKGSDLIISHLLSQ
ncbi:MULTISPECIES: GDSL-type esterase/lipase family protein [Morganellaceae]|uniref:DUF459 domain-containing protein n=1 Tax=Morganellaceae TaxID=1903414 RepID=UPI0009EDD5EE|nr:GDSL-type esterase/lipase family protein [Morganella psychrotolerans]